MFFQKRSQQHQAMRRLARRLKKAGIPYALMGAMAVNAHGAERTTRDVDILLALAARKKPVVVIGGGLLGLEAAYGLAKAGTPVTLLHLMDRLMERQLDHGSAAMLLPAMRELGVDVELDRRTA